MSEKRFKSHIENALRGCQFGVKLGKNMGYPYWILTPTKGFFCFSSGRLCQISSKSVQNCDRESTDTQTDTYTEITQVIL